jgi:hypothetical protein
MVDILRACHPLKIAQSVIGAAKIYMVYLLPLWLRTNERFGNKRVYEAHAAPPPEPKIDGHISLAVWLRKQYLSGLRSAASKNALDAPRVGHFVDSFPSDDGNPKFRVRIWCIHDSFLLNRNEDWLEAGEVYHHLPVSFSLSLAVS